tara:strand:+ start:516 stop:1265 length:750 start_codon:yes stop_codon:yes gene_type:complete
MKIPATFVDLEDGLRSYDVNADVSIAISDAGEAPSTTTQSHINVIWEAAIARQDHLLFDGTVLSVASITPEHITVYRDSYKSFFAQCQKPDLFEDLAIRPLACSGLIQCKDGFVFAKRGNHMFLDAGCWELAPSGTFDEDAVDRDGKIDAGRFLLRELQEELGIEPSLARPGKVLGVFEHQEFRGVDLAIDVQLDLTEEQLRTHFEANDNHEYSALAVVPKNKLGEFTTQADAKFVPLSLRLLGRTGLI